MSTPKSNIYEVIDNFWGREPLAKIMRADKIALKRFGTEVNRFYASSVPVAVPPGSFRTYYGGLVATNFSLKGKQTTLFNNLLYAHSTVIPDPVARWYFDDYEKLSKTPPVNFGAAGAADQSEWIGWLLSSNRAFQWNLELSREVLHFYVAGLMQIRPLVESGIVILLSQAHVLLTESEQVVREALSDASSEQFKAALVAVDEKLPLWDSLRGGIMTINSGGKGPDAAAVKWAEAKEASYHIRKNLAIAAAAGARYIPENLTDYGLLKAVLVSHSSRAGYTDLKFEIARVVGDLQVPSLEGVSLADLVSIRKNETAFEDFRVWLSRRLFTVQGQDAGSLIELTADELNSEISRLRQQLSTSSTIKAYVKQDGLKLAFGALVGYAVNHSIGPVAGALSAALAGVGSSILQRNRTAKSSVIAQLARMGRTAEDATFGAQGKPPGLPRALAQPFLGEVRTGPPPTEPEKYTPRKLREIVSQSLEPPTASNPYRAVAARR